MGSECALRDGRTVALRAARAADTPAITRLYMELGRESFQRRFQAARPSPGVVAALARLDRPPATAVVAEAPGEPGGLVGEARYARVGEDVAEVGLAVLDAYQGAGLGRRLLAALVERARRRGLRRLRAVVSVSNTPMLSLLAPYGWALAEETDEFAVATLEVSAVGGMPGWPDGTRGRRVLVERRGWRDDALAAALRAAGDEIRVCPGPGRPGGRACPLPAGGRCRLAEEADLVVDLLPGDDAACEAVLAEHRRRWPGRLVAPDRSAAAAGAVVARDRILRA